MPLCINFFMEVNMYCKYIFLKIVNLYGYYNHILFKQLCKQTNKSNVM